MGRRCWSASSSRYTSSAPAPTRWSGVARGSPTTPSLPPLVIIAGATASGKTALALQLSASLPGAEIVSADSRQVYRGMDIATAKPSAAELQVAPHHCLDLVEPDAPFTAADYQRAALAALAGIAERGGIALLVGGTGLYLRAIARGYPLDEGSSDPLLRAELEARNADEGVEALGAELRQRDAAAADVVDLRNPRRVIRALERAILTGSALPPPPRGIPRAPRLAGTAPPASRSPACHRGTRRRALRRRPAGGSDAAALALPRGPAGIQRDGLSRGLRRPRRAL